jgi:exopolysaccharide production protein ExoZ
MFWVLIAASVIGFGYHSWYRVLANPMLLEFLAGVALARLWIRGRFARLPRAAGWGLIVLGLAILAAQQVGGLRDDFLRPFVWGPPAAMIVAGALKLDADGRVGSGPLERSLVGIGDGSYSLYLVQAPVIAAFASLTPAWPAVLRAPAALALAVAAGWFCYRLVERPLGSARLGRLHEARRRDGSVLGLAEQEALGAVDADLA